MKTEWPNEYDNSYLKYAKSEWTENKKKNTKTKIYDHDDDPFLKSD